MKIKAFCFKMLFLTLIFKDIFGVQLSAKVNTISDYQMEWNQAGEIDISNKLFSFKYYQENGSQGKINTQLSLSSSEKSKNVDKNSSVWLNILVIILLFSVLSSLILYFYYNSQKVNQKKIMNGLRAFRENSMPLPNVIYPNLFEKADPLAILFKRIIEGFESDKIHDDPNMSIELFAEQINSYPRYIQAAIKTYANCDFYHILHFYRVNEIITNLKYQDSKFQNVDDLLRTSGYRTFEEFNIHFQSFMGVDFKHFRKFMFKEIK